MKGIGGNLTALIQTCTTEDNKLGENVQVWNTVQQIKGFLDLSADNSKYTSYNAKLQESTHIFIADFVPLASGVTNENARLMIGGKVYDLLHIDDPMELHQQLEFYLKYTGGQ